MKTLGINNNLMTYYFVYLMLHIPLEIRRLMKASQKSSIVNRYRSKQKVVFPTFFNLSLDFAIGS